MKTNLINILVLFTCLITGKTMAQDKFTINGTLPKAGTEKMVLLTFINANGKSIIDSTILTNGKFVFKGNTAFGNKAYLELKAIKKDASKRTNPDFIDFYLEKGTTTLKGVDSMAKASITGTKVQNEYNQYNAQTARLIAQFKEISARFAKVYYAKVKDSVEIKRIQAEAKPIHAKIEAALDSFIFNHPDSYVTADLIHQNKMAVIDVVKFDPYYQILTPRVRASFTGKKITDKYDKAKQFAVGKSIDFTLPDKDGKEFKLSSLKGKYVLVDFWASWCVPCRAENPFLLKAYHELKDKNFEIVGVSLDDTKAAWMRAVEQDKLPWTQVSDVKGFKTEVAVRFGITAIPQNVLIDPAGKVIAKDLRGEDVNKKIASFIK
ncbi:TlpA disulfide reductase family protein [Pedobacter terrae]|uniref:TlpA disulfide reductase family protein n=1 Tax=Pedobacter terrae TaxID=405671 RepID=UPI002FFC7390